MATQLKIVNNILGRLREDPVSSVADNVYAKLMATFVNDAKEDIEDMNHEWSVYETVVETPILNDGTRVYNIVETNDRSWLMRSTPADQVPMAFDVTAGEVGQLFDCPYKLLKQERALTNSPQTSTRPDVFAVIAGPDGRSWSIELLWELDSSFTTRTWRTFWYVPQPELLNDGSDDNTEILLPRRAVELRALYYALNERGEEMGEPGGLAWGRSENAIGAAMEIDAVVQKKSDEININNNESL